MYFKASSSYLKKCITSLSASYVLKSLPLSSLKIYKIQIAFVLIPSPIFEVSVSKIAAIENFFFSCLIIYKKFSNINNNIHQICRATIFMRSCWPIICCIICISTSLFISLRILFFLSNNFSNFIKFNITV